MIPEYKVRIRDFPISDMIPAENFFAQNEEYRAFMAAMAVVYDRAHGLTHDSEYLQSMLDLHIIGPLINQVDVLVSSARVLVLQKIYTDNKEEISDIMSHRINRNWVKN